MANHWHPRAAGLLDLGLCPSLESDHGHLPTFTDHYGTEKLLVSLAMGKVDKCRFLPADFA